jgi:iron complex transport system substrate-binding protein
MSSPQSQSAPPSKGGSPFAAALWLVPIILIAVLGYVLQQALSGEKTPPPKPPIITDGANAGGFPRTITDDSGSKVVITSKPMRIVAGDAGCYDVLCALIEPSRFAAIPFTVQDYAGAKEYFDLHKDVPRFKKFNAETLLSFKPDLVIASAFHDTGVLSIVRDAGVPSIRFELYRTFEGIRGFINVVGRAVGEDEKTAALLKNFDQRLAFVAKAIEGRKKPRMLAYSNYGGSGTVVGGGESQDEIMRRAGAINVAAEMKLTGHSAFSFEQILKADPDWLVVSGEQGLKSEQVLILINDPVLSELSAIKQRRIAVVPDRYFTSISQYVVDAVESLAAQLHPDAFGKAGAP